MSAGLKMQVDVEQLPLKAPFRISGYTFTEVPVAVVTLQSEGTERTWRSCGRLLPR